MLFNDIEHLKLTYLTLTKLSHNFKLVNNVKQIFGKKVENDVLDKRALVLIDMIRKVLKVQIYILKLLKSQTHQIDIIYHLVFIEMIIQIHML